MAEYTYGKQHDSAIEAEEAAGHMRQHGWNIDSPGPAEAWAESCDGRHWSYVKLESEFTAEHLDQLAALTGYERIS